MASKRNSKLIAYILRRPFTSISSFELPPSPGPSSPDKLTVPAVSEPSMPSSSATTPAQNLNAVASSSATGAGRTISPLPSRPAVANVAAPVRVPVLAVPTSINEHTYCLPLSAISAPPPPPPSSTTDFTSDWDQAYEPPLEAGMPRIPLPLVSTYARTLYPLPTLPADAAKKAANKARKKGSSSASAMGGPNGNGVGVPQPPADLYKWAATVHANPLSGMLRLAKKCLGSADWEVSALVLQLIQSPILT